MGNAGNSTGGANARIADADKGNWVDAYAPGPIKPYLKLARLDRPIGWWLLMWPCWWSTALASQSTGILAPIWMFVLFALGAIIMRGAGCTFNDITDHKIDAGVARTSQRPLPSGQVSLLKAYGFLGFLCLLGLAVLVQFNQFTIWLGISSLGLVVIYPFMKRVTYWPQLFLGLAFNWGALVGWSAVTGTLHPAALALYAGGIAWTIGYDTIYAHMDKDDDLLAGIKSTALRFGDNTGIWISGFYAFALASFALALILAQSGPFSWAGLAAMGLHLAWQLKKLDINNTPHCLRLFRANRDAGALLFAGLVADVFL